LLVKEIQESGEYQTEINSSNLENGIYYCKFTVNGKFAVQQIIINK